MVDVEALREEFRKNNLKQYQVAQKMGMHPAVLSNKMNKRKFDTDDVYMLLKVLPTITNPTPIFFAEKVN
jgi:transcriptional regulator with XRE-family HTH domain